MIQATGIHKSYGSLEVLKGIDLHINKKEIVSIVGASGAGKSTLLHIIGTLDKADRGQLIIDGTEVGKLNDTQLAAFRNQKIGFVFQFHHLLPEFTALENICIPAYIGGMGKKEATERAEKLLDYLNLTDRKTHKPSELSRLPEGSSASTTAGWLMRARATATRCCSPPDSCDGL